jgi:hypothetical protein
LAKAWHYVCNIPPAVFGYSRVDVVKNIGVFSQNNFCKKTSCSMSKKRGFLRQFFGENILLKS